jgi:MFS family permease
VRETERIEATHHPAFTAGAGQALAAPPSGALGSPTPLAAGIAVAPGATTKPAGPAPSRGIRLQTFTALRHGAFRMLWAGTVATTCAQFLQGYTLSWLAYSLTGSAALVGAVVASTAILALVVGPMAGVLSDQFDRRHIGMLGQGALASTSVILGLLVLTDQLALWHLLAYGLISGAAWSVIHPVRHALTPLTVPRPDLLNAVALNSIALHSSRLVAPILGGLLVATSGVGANFFALTGCSLVACAALGLIPAPEPAARLRRQSVGASLVAGLRYLRADATVGGVLFLGIALQLLLLPTLALVPVFAVEAIGTGPAGAGLLFGAGGLGALAATLILASLGDVRRKGAALLGAGAGAGVALVLCAMAPSLLLATSGLVLVGMAHGTFFSLNNALLQAHTADEYRGRVTSISTLNQSAVFLGGFLTGPLAAHLGARATFALIGIAMVALCLGTAARVPRLRSLT